MARQPERLPKIRAILETYAGVVERKGGLGKMSAKDFRELSDVATEDVLLVFGPKPAKPDSKQKKLAKSDAKVLAKSKSKPEPADSKA